MISVFLFAGERAMSFSVMEGFSKGLLSPFVIEEIELVLEVGTDLVSGQKGYAFPDAGDRHRVEFLIVVDDPMCGLQKFRKESIFLCLVEVSEEIRLLSGEEWAHLFPESLQFMDDERECPLDIESFMFLHLKRSFKNEDSGTNISIQTITILASVKIFPQKNPN